MSTEWAKDGRSQIPAVLDMRLVASVEDDDLDLGVLTPDPGGSAMKEISWTALGERVVGSPVHWYAGRRFRGPLSVHEYPRTKVPIGVM